MMVDPKPPAVAAGPDPEERWARNLIAELGFAALVEKRRTRRWGIFFKLLFFVYLIVLLLLVRPWDMGSLGVGEQHAALVRVDGVIASDAEAGAANVIAGLRAAFKHHNVAGVIVAINSPGGSPVQAGEIYDEIRRLRQAHPDMPIYAVAGDTCASGGYYIAAAAQKIYANQASLVGSIGVVAGGFGFVDAMNKLGISRRIYTAGDNKAFLDPFSPARPEDVSHLEGMLDEVHRQFINAVRQGRGERLRETPEMFSGLVWTGAKSVELGLVDELADVRHVAEVVIGTGKVVDYTKRKLWLEQVLGKVESNFDPAPWEWWGFGRNGWLR